MGHTHYRYACAKNIEIVSYFHNTYSKNISFYRIIMAIYRYDEIIIGDRMKC